MREVTFGDALILRFAHLGQLYCRVERPAPCAKILGGELWCGRSLDVIVNVARAYRASFTVLAQIVEKLRAADGLDVRHQHRQFFVNDYAAMAYVVFADEGE